MEAAQQLGGTPLWHAQSLIGTGRVEEALEHLGGIIRSRPTWSEAWSLLAQALSLASRFPEALQAADQALELDSGHIHAQQLRTGLLLQLGYTDTALEAARRLADMGPSRPESFAFLAFAEAFSGNERAALHAARRCRRLAPHRGYGHQALCVVHLTFRRWDKAERHALAALSLEGPVASVFHDLGVARFELGKLREAHEAFALAAQMDPRFAGSLARMEKPARITPATIAVIVVIAAGLALLPLGHAPAAFAAVAIVGVSALLVAAQLRGARLAHWSEALRPALGAVLVFDAVMLVRQLGIIG